MLTERLCLLFAAPFSMLELYFLLSFLAQYVADFANKYTWIDEKTATQNFSRQLEQWATFSLF